MTYIYILWGKVFLVSDALHREGKLEEDGSFRYLAGCEAVERTAVNMFGRFEFMVKIGLLRQAGSLEIVVRTLSNGTTGCGWMDDVTAVIPCHTNCISIKTKTGDCDEQKNNK